MFLQKLEIQGFKSFARKAVFEFSPSSNHDAKAKSITGIVGPNGSGKSNVADAIRWVLGEQSLKLIRCKKADDVIFGGSESKARQGFAEVILYMNNEDRELPIEYAEVALTRRVYRDGETEYLINKNRVRLFDILMLLAKANFGQRSYSIIGQGMVDHIINITAFERKEFFDEATGVKQYQIKRDQAVGRLKRSRENLNQSNQIVAELEPRLRLLTRQIKKLEKRKEIEGELRERQKKYYAKMIQKLQIDRGGLDERFNVKDALRQDWQGRLDAVQTGLAASAREESRKEIFNNLQKDFNKLNSEKNNFLQEMAVLNGKMSLEYVKVGKQNLSWLESRKDELDRRVAEIQESLNNLDVRLGHKRQTLTESEASILDLNDQVVTLSNNLRAAEEDLAAIRRGGASNGNMEAVRAILRQSTFAKASVDRRGSIDGIFGTVAELGKTEPMYELALSTAAGGKLGAVIVQNDQVAVRCINYLKENKLGAVTFLPLNKIQGFVPKAETRKLLTANGAIGFAVELATFDQKYRKAFNYVFGSTVVVDTVDNARAIGVGLERMVTLGGDVLEKSGAMRGGFVRREGGGWQFGAEDRRAASQEDKMKEVAILRSKLDDLVKQKQATGEEINNLRVEVQVAETKQKALGNDLLTLNKEKQKVVAEIEENQVAPEDQDRYLKNLTMKKQELERQIEKIEKQAGEVRRKIDEFNLDEEKKKTELFRLQAEMQKDQNSLNEVNAELNDIKIQLAKIEAKQEDLDKEISAELGAGVDLSAVDAAEVLNADQFWFEISKLKHNLEQIGGIDVEIVDEHKEVESRYTFLTAQAQDLEKAITDLEKIVVELDVIIDKQFGESFKKINQAFT
ncbi:hypothetical protein A2482_04630, partial [Candidatus Falkowbacteria bacterium RIFOXYC2_FULL_48_21]